MKESLLKKDGTQKLLASLLSIVIGLAVGAIVVAIVGFTKPNIGSTGVWDGVRLIFFGLLADGRGATGSLVWGFDKLIESRTGIETHVADDAISCVAHGTGKSLDSLDQMQDGTMNLSRRRQMNY